MLSTWNSRYAPSGTLTNPMPVHDGVRSGMYWRSIMFTPYETGNGYFNTDPLNLQAPQGYMKCEILLVDDFWTALSTVCNPEHKFSFKSIHVHTIALSLNNTTNAREIKQNKTA